MSNLAKQLLNDLKPEDKAVVRSWAEEAFIIRDNKQLTNAEKIKNLFAITQRNQIVLKFLKQFALLIKKHGWDKRSWSSRLALTGLLIGVGISGGKMAGVASAGIGLGVPVFLLTSAGGALLGTILNELNK